MSNNTYRPDIDGLRAIAILSVLGFHAFPRAVPGGFAGVDIFFVISGFLISGILFDQSGRGTLSIAGFYARRIRRIFPALALVLATTLGLGWMVMSPDELRRLGYDIAAGAGFVSNLRLWGEAGYFDSPSASKPLLHLWSLGIEEQFYIVWPLVILLIGRNRKVMRILLPSLFAASLLANLVLVARWPNLTFYLPVTRFWELLAGALLASKAASPRPSAVRAWLGLALVVASVLVLDAELSFPGWWAMVPVAGTVLTISAGAEVWPNRQLLGNRALVFVGLISYPLYLWHWPLLAFERILLAGNSSPFLRPGAILVSFALAFLTWRFVERRVRNAIRTATGWTVPATLCGLVATLAAAALLVGSGWHQPADPLVRFHQSLRNGWGIYGMEVPGCGMSSATPPGLTYCYSDSRQPPAMAIIGDSHAGALFPALLRESIPGERWMLLGRSGCLPALGIIRLATRDAAEAEECYEAADRMIHAVAANPAIRTVVVAAAARVTGTLAPETSEGRPPRYARAGSRVADPSAVPAGLEATIALLAGAGKRVVILIDNPSLPEPVNCERYIRGWGRRINPACEITRQREDEVYRNYRALIAGLQSVRPALIVFDPTRLLCPDGRCRVINDGASWYSFSDHLSDTGGDIVARGLIGFLHGPL